MPPKKGCLRVSKPRKKKNYYFQYRSSIVSLLKLFTELPLKEKHIKALERTPFCYLFQGLIYNKMESTAFKKRDDDVVRIIQSFDSKLKLFKLGNKPVMLRESDITLILGILSGPETLKISYGAKPTNSAFLTRRFHPEDKLDSPTIREKIEEAITGDSSDDVEDTVRLCCLYLFLNFLFSTTGPNLSWALFSSVENIHDLKKYAWAKAILNNLTAQIQAKHRQPEKVTGCVMVLLYWLCEHTNLIKEEQHEDKIPRFLKWHLKKLHSSIKNRDLTKLKSQEVSGGELNQTTNEVQKFLMLREKLEKEAETQDTQVGEVFGTQLTNTQQTNTQPPDTQQLDSSQDTKFDTLYSASRDEGIQVTASKEHAFHLDDMDQLFHVQVSDEHTTQQRRKDPSEEDNNEEANNENQQLKNLIQELTCQNDDLKKALELKEQEINQLKDSNKVVQEERTNLEETIRKCKEKIKSLRAENDKLVDDLTESVCQSVTQVNEHNQKIELLKQQLEEKIKENEQQCKKLNELHKKATCNSGKKQRSMVARIKSYPRKKPYDPDFEYIPVKKNSKITKGKKRKSPVKKDSNITWPKKKKGEEDEPSNIEDLRADRAGEEPPMNIQPLALKLPKNNVTKQLPKKDLGILENILRLKGSGAVLWKRDDIILCFNDLHQLMTDSSISTTVVDAYMKILEEQDPSRKLFFFSSLSWSALNNERNETMRKHLLDKNIPQSIMFEYLFFPIVADQHFTLLVCRPISKTWMFFNSLRPRTTATKDTHLGCAENLKIYIETLYMENGLLTPDKPGKLYSIENCPQQTPGSLDCGIIVCNIMKQMAEKRTTPPKMTKHQCDSFRADLVHLFLNHRNFIASKSSN